MSEAKSDPPKSGRQPRKTWKTRCVHKANSTGEQCRRWANKGGTLCAMHGGNAKHIREKAKERLLELVHPALAELRKVLLQTDASDGNKIRAINMILDRALGPVAQQFQIDMQAEHMLWTGALVSEGVAWVSGAEDEESAAAEAHLVATTQLQVEAGRMDDVDEPLRDVVDAELVDDDPDDPWSSSPAAQGRKLRDLRRKHYAQR